jgi:hypothetical protein
VRGFVARHRSHQRARVDDRTIESQSQADGIVRMSVSVLLRVIPTPISLDSPGEHARTVTSVLKMARFESLAGTGLSPSACWRGLCAEFFEPRGQLHMDPRLLSTLRMRIPLGLTGKHVCTRVVV